jgi:hypothetical protein
VWFQLFFLLCMVWFGFGAVLRPLAALLVQVQRIVLYETTKQTLTNSCYSQGPFGTTSPAASEAVLSEAVPMGIPKQLRRGSGRKTCSLEQFGPGKAAKGQLPPLRLGVSHPYPRGTHAVVVAHRPTMASRRRGAGRRTYGDAVEPSDRPAAARRREGPRQARSMHTAYMSDGEAPAGELRAATSMVGRGAPRVRLHRRPWCSARPASVGVGEAPAWEAPAAASMIGGGLRLDHNTTRVAGAMSANG